MNIISVARECNRTVMNSEKALKIILIGPHKRYSTLAKLFYGL